MKWIVAATSSSVVGYTLVNLFFPQARPRLPPYERHRTTGHHARLLAAGWQEDAVDTRRPTENPSAGRRCRPVNRDCPGWARPGVQICRKTEAPRQHRPRGLAPPQSAAWRLLRILRRACRPSKAQVGEISLYRKGNELCWWPTTEPLPGSGLKSRWNDSDLLVSSRTTGLRRAGTSCASSPKGPAASWAFTVK